MPVLAEDRPIVASNLLPCSFGVAATKLTQQHFLLNQELVKTKMVARVDLLEVPATKDGVG